MTLEPFTKEYVITYIQETCFDLKSTQQELSLPLLNRLAKKMFHKLSFPNINVCEGLLIDGHHRYIASQLVNFKIGINPSNKSPTTSACEWKIVNITEHDYDQLEDIERHLETDAKYNNININELKKILE